jgi:LPS-assembly protein
VPDDLATATGKVRINRAGNVYEGSELQLHVNAFEAFSTMRATVAGQRRAWRGHARGFHRTATARWCTTPPTPPAREDFADWQPDWILRAER